MERTKLKYLIGGLLLYFLSTGVSYAVFDFAQGQKTETITSPLPVSSGFPGELRIDPNAPKTEACPLNGKLYTKKEREIWESRRPLAVMIENHEESRPQSGLSRADIVYEAVAEGGITRFMGVLYCGVAAKNLLLAPIRSARTYYLDWVLEYDALYNHVGGAGRCNDPTVDERAKALCQIDKYGIKDLDQFGIGFPDCYRNPDRLDHPVATEHQMICLSDNLYEIAKQKSWTNVDEEGIPWDENFSSWLFKDDLAKEQRPASFSAQFNFWSGYKAYQAKWQYEKSTNDYKRFTGGKVHFDKEENIQLSAKNVVIQFTAEIGPVDEHVHLLYETIGTGKAMIFQDGKVINGTWSKSKRTARTIFFDQFGREIQFNRGEIWIEIVPIGTKIEIIQS